jgi:cytoskeletal protein RodZ
LPPVARTNDFVIKDRPDPQSPRVAHVLADAQNRTQLSQELDDSPKSSSTQGVEFEEQPLFTRTRVILGFVALVLVAAVIAILFRPTQVTRRPPLPQPDQTVGPVSPDNQPPLPPQPETKAPENKIQTLDRSPEKPVAKGTAAVAKPQPPPKPSAGNRVKVATEVVEEPEAQADSGGLSQSDVPGLLSMARKDAGDGKYEKAGREFRTILKLQPNNPDARDGLRKLNLAQKDQQ